MESAARATGPNADWQLRPCPQCPVFFPTTRPPQLPYWTYWICPVRPPPVPRPPLLRAGTRATTPPLPGGDIQRLPVSTACPLDLSVGSIRWTYPLTHGIPRSVSRTRCLHLLVEVAWTEVSSSTPTGLPHSHLPWLTRLSRRPRRRQALRRAPAGLDPQHPGPGLIAVQPLSSLGLNWG